MTITVENLELKLKDQTRDYIDRGDDLQHMSYLDFFLDTYEGETVQVLDGEHRGGCKQSDRSPYRPETGHDNKCRVLRQPGHETLPDFVGHWFPR